MQNSKPKIKEGDIWLFWNSVCITTGFHDFRCKEYNWEDGGSSWDIGLYFFTIYIFTSPKSI